MKKEIIIYTMDSCPYCKEIKDLLKEKNIKFTEKDRAEFTGEWFRVVQLTGIPMFPTFTVDGEYFVPTRDFRNSNEAANIMEYMTSKEYKKWDIQTKIYEKLKTTGLNIHNQFVNLNKKDKNEEI